MTYAYNCYTLRSQERAFSTYNNDGNNGRNTSRGGGMEEHMAGCGGGFEDFGSGGGRGGNSRRFGVPWYAVAAAVGMFGLAWAAVPLYKIFCQSTGYDGTTQRHNATYTLPESNEEEEGNKEKKNNRLIEVDFAATIGGNLPWEFRPTQKKLLISPGETALAFFTAKNLTDRPIIGMSVYSVIPPEVGVYFNKIQCFCFEEQMLNPNEEIDMPVFFFLDPEICKDPRLSDVDNITLSYIFFESDSEIPEEYKHLPFAQKTTLQPKLSDV